QNRVTAKGKAGAHRKRRRRVGARQLDSRHRRRQKVGSAASICLGEVQSSVAESGQRRQILAPALLRTVHLSSERLNLRLHEFPQRLQVLLLLFRPPELHSGSSSMLFLFETRRLNSSARGLRLLFPQRFAETLLRLFHELAVALGVNERVRL